MLDSHAVARTIRHLAMVHHLEIYALHGDEIQDRSKESRTGVNARAELTHLAG